MKVTLLFLYLTLIQNIPAEKGEIVISIENIKSTKGVVIVALFDDEHSFLKKVYRSKTISLSQAKKLIRFENVPEGSYAVSVIHDENENGELDTNWAGIPKEPFGFSRKTISKFGPPSFEDTCIQLKGGSIETTVKMRTLF
ncbi:MAG: DUF2141 domain-containing protein [Bacteroidota bacterium]